MVCTKYEYAEGGARGSFVADTLSGTLPETFEGIKGGAGKGVKIAAGSELLVTGTAEVYVKKEEDGWNKL